MILVRACTILCSALLVPICTSSRAFAEEVPAAESQSTAALPRIGSAGSIYYPDEAKRLNAQGRILLGFEINNHGRATHVSIESAEGNKILSDSAVSLLKAMKFERPAVPGPTGVPVQCRMSVVFELTPCGTLHHFDVPKNAQISVCGTPLRRL
jgi:TonB family protein